MSWGICVRRYARFYMMKICIMLWLNTLLGAMTYFFDVMEVAVKIEIIVGCFTAVIAFLFVINDKLPKTPFLHKMDMLVIVSLVYIFFAGVQGVVAYQIINAGMSGCESHDCIVEKVVPAPNNSTVVRRVFEGVYIAARERAQWFDLIAFIALLAGYVLFNFNAFMVPYMGFSCKAADKTRPKHLHAGKTFVPKSKLIHIDLDAE